MKMIKRLIIFVLLISIIGILLYTCSAPTAVEGLTAAGGSGTAFVSEAVIPGGTGGNSTFLVVTPNPTSIAISLRSAASAADAATTTTTIGTETITSSSNQISGVYPYVNFQGGGYSGAITFLNEEKIKITFQQHDYPYFKMRDVICAKRN